MAAAVATKKALKHYHNLVVVAYQDGRLDEHELALLNQMQRRLGLTDEEATKERDLVYGGNRDLSTAGAPEERTALLADLAEMAFADGVMSEAEFEKMAELAKRLGGTADEMERIVRRTTERLREANAPAGSGVPSWLVQLFVIAAVAGTVAWLDWTCFWKVTP